MARKKVKKSQSKTKKKVWVTIKSPKVFGGHDIGECMVEEPKDAIGRHISVNLMNITRDPKKQGINVRFQVATVHSTHAGTIFNRYRVMPSSTKRMVRRNKNRVDHAFKCKTADGVTLTVKPIVLTMNKCKKSVTQAIRKKVVSFIYYHFNKKNLNQVVQDIIQTKIQFALKKSLAKIHPIAICELREVVVSSYGEEALKAAAEEKIEPKKPVRTAEASKPLPKAASKKVDKTEKTDDKPAPATGAEKTEEKAEKKEDKAAPKEEKEDKAAPEEKAAQDAEKKDDKAEPEKDEKPAKQAKTEEPAEKEKPKKEDKPKKAKAEEPKEE